MASHSITSYIADRIAAYKHDYAAEEQTILGEFKNDIVLSSISEYAAEIGESIDSYYRDVNTQLENIKFPAKGSSTFAPIYGFKELAIGSNTTDGHVSHSVLALSGIYQQNLQAFQNTYTLSSLYDTTLANKEGETTKILPFLRSNSFNLNQMLCKNVNDDPVDSVIHANDIIFILKQLMRQLSTIRRLKCNLYYKYTDMNGNMNVAVCTDCAIPLYVVSTNEILAGDNLDKKTAKITAYGGNAWRMYVSPYAIHTYVQPKLSIANERQHGSNSMISLYSNTLETANGDISQLYSIDQFFSDNPSFDCSTNDGSNGKFTAFKTITANTFDLEQHVDLETMFKIKYGETIYARNVIAAITYIFELWRKNIKTIQYDFYVCHYNCHGNTINVNSEGTGEAENYDIVTDESIIDTLIGACPRIFYKSQDQDTAYYADPNRVQDGSTQMIPLNVNFPYVSCYGYVTAGDEKSFKTEFPQTYFNGKVQVKATIKYSGKMKPQFTSLTATSINDVSFDNPHHCESRKIQEVKPNTAYFEKPDKNTGNLTCTYSFVKNPCAVPLTIAKVEKALATSTMAVDGKTIDCYVGTDKYIRIAAIPKQKYTGAVIIPEVYVYDGYDMSKVKEYFSSGVPDGTPAHPLKWTRLIKDVNYTVANSSGTKYKGQIKIAGKGLYTGSSVIPFEIDTPNINLNDLGNPIEGTVDKTEEAKAVNVFIVIDKVDENGDIKTEYYSNIGTELVIDYKGSGINALQNFRVVIANVDKNDKTKILEPIADNIYDNAGGKLFKYKAVNNTKPTDTDVKTKKSYIEVSGVTGATKTQGVYGKYKIYYRIKKRAVNLSEYNRDDILWVCPGDGEETKALGPTSQKYEAYLDQINELYNGLQVDLFGKNKVDYFVTETKSGSSVTCTFRGPASVKELEKAKTDPASPVYLTGPDFTYTYTLDTGS